MKPPRRTQIKSNKEKAKSLSKKGYSIYEIVPQLRKPNGDKYSDKSYGLIARWINEGK